MGFKGVLHRMLLFAWVLSVAVITLLLYTWVLRWDLLKPMQIPIHPNTRVLKPMQIAAKLSLEPYFLSQKCLKPMRITAKVKQKGPARRRTTSNSKA